MVASPYLSTPHAYTRQCHRHGPELEPRKRIRGSICTNTQFALLVH